ncbi:hypothetical protein QUC31_014241 [Theobroma cacao]
MGSEGPKAVTIHVTGFKKFQGVAENPTETITAGNGALPMLYKVLESGISGINANNEQVIWLHMGVNSGAQQFALEKQAVNEATFRCPDELGWQPQQLQVVAEDGGTYRKREADLYAIMSTTTAEQKGHKSLFVHVPIFSKINEETQMQFSASLLEAIASTC